MKFTDQPIPFRACYKGETTVEVNTAEQFVKASDELRGRRSHDAHADLNLAEQFAALSRDRWARR
jgi:hypothetical protein